MYLKNYTSSFVKENILYDLETGMSPLLSAHNR